MNTVFCMVTQKSYEVGKCVKRFRRGTTVMDSDFIDYYIYGPAFVCVQRGNGYQSVTVCDVVPENLHGYGSSEQ